MTELNAINETKAAKYVDDLVRKANNIGSPLSKAYMIGITVQDTYGNAKAAGASDLEAALLTLGYAGGEAWILNTGLGEWILPELHIDKFKIKLQLKLQLNQLMMLKKDQNRLETSKDL